MINKFKLSDVKMELMVEELDVLDAIAKDEQMDMSKQKQEFAADITKCDNIVDIIKTLEGYGHSTYDAIERLFNILVEDDTKPEPETEGERIIREMFENQERLKKEYYEWLAKQS